MFEWFDRLFRQTQDNRRQSIVDTVDELNAEAGGGRPQSYSKFLGRLQIPSRTLVIDDPMLLGAVEVSGFSKSEVEIFAQLWRYPSGSGTVASLTIIAGSDAQVDTHRKVGEVLIDSASAFIADKSDFETHWAETGNERIGFISTARDKRVLKRLQHKFKFKVRRLNGIHSEVVGPVSVELEQEIERYLETFPEYVDYPYFHFRVETNNSFERVNSLEKVWDFIPVGNCDIPKMFACQTGYGDGAYDVNCGFSANRPQIVKISFIETGDSETQ